MKANPAAPVLERLVSSVEQFRRRELRGDRGLPGRRRASRTRSASATPSRRSSAICRAHEAGVSHVRLRLAARNWKSSRATRRAAASIAASWWRTPAPTGRCRASSAPRVEMARDLMLRAGELGLDPYGLSFHVGSQQTETASYEAAIGQRGDAVHRPDRGRREPAHGQPRRRLPGRATATRCRRSTASATPSCGAMTKHFGNALPGDGDRAGPLHRRRRRRGVGRGGAGQPARPRLIRCAGCIWTSAGSAAWRKPRARRSNTASPRRTTAADWARWRSPARPATAPTSCTSAATTACRWRLTSGDRVELLVDRCVCDHLRQPAVQRLRPARRTLYLTLRPPPQQPPLPHCGRGPGRGCSHRCRPLRITPRQRGAGHQLDLVEQHQRQHDQRRPAGRRTARSPSAGRSPGSSSSRRTRW